MVAVANNKYVDDERGIVVEAIGCIDNLLLCRGCIYNDRAQVRCGKPKTVPDCHDEDDVNNFIFIKKGVII